MPRASPPDDTKAILFPPQVTLRVKEDGNGRFSGRYEERWPVNQENRLRMNNSVQQLCKEFSGHGRISVQQRETSRHLIVAIAFVGVRREVIGGMLAAEFTAWTGDVAPTLGELKASLQLLIESRIDDIFRAATGGNELAQFFLDANPEIRRIFQVSRQQTPVELVCATDGVYRPL